MTRVRSTCFYLLAAWTLLASLTPALLAQNAPFDLQNVADKPLAVLWSRPLEHLKNPVLAELFKFVSEAPPSPRDKVMMQNMAKVDSMRVSFGQGRTVWSPKPMPQAVIVYHTTEPTAATAILKELSTGQDEKTTPEWKSPIYTHKAFGPQGANTDDSAWKLQRGITQLDPQTIVQTDNIELMLKTIGAKPAAPAWATDLAGITTAQSLYLVDLAQFRELIKDEKGPEGGFPGMIFNSVKPLWEQADYAFFQIDTTQGIQLTAFAKSPNAESATRFKGALEGLLAMGKGFLPLAKQGLAQMNQVMPGQGDALYTDLEALVASIKVTQTGTQTQLTMSIPQETLVRLVKSMMPAIQAARAQAMKMQGMNNLKQISLALLNYHDANRSFPAAVILGRDGKTTHSWRVAILPYIEEAALYNEYKFDEPWDSENNKKVAAKMPQIYRSATATNGPNCTSYFVLTHPDGIFSSTPAAKGTLMRQITDGTSQTVAVVEANAEIPWTKPEDLAIVDGQPVPKLGLPGATTFNAAFCDGSVHALSTAIKDELLRNLVNRKDGNVINFEEVEEPANAPPRAVPSSAPAKAMPAPPPVLVPTKPAPAP